MTSALFVYSPVHPLFDGQLSQSTQQPQTVNQVDIVPTLSSILGLPIPFSNVGSTILRCMPAPLLDSVDKVAVVLQRNIEQITNYVEAYSLKDSRFKTAELEVLLFNHKKLSEKMSKIMLDNDNGIVDLLGEYDEYMLQVLQMCRRAWVDFDTTNILVGLFLFILSTFAGYFLVNEHVWQKMLANRHFFTIYSRRLLCSSLILLLLSFLLSIIAVIFSVSLVKVVATIGFCSLFAMIWLCMRQFSAIASFCDGKATPMVVANIHVTVPVTDLFVIFCSVCSFLAFFSNSYVVEESSIILFFVISVIWFFLAMAVRRRHSQQSKSPTSLVSISCLQQTINIFRSELFINAMIVCFAFRWTFLFTKCREAEQQPRCKDVILSKQFESHLSVILCFFNAVVLLVFVRVWQRPKCTCGGDLCAVTLRCIAAMCSVLLAVCWTYPSLYSFNYPLISVFIEKTPSVVFVISLISLCYLFYMPPNLHRAHCDPSLQASVYDEIYSNVIVFVTLLSCGLSAPAYVIPSILTIVTLRSLAVFLNLSRKFSADVSQSPSSSAPISLSYNGNQPIIPPILTCIYQK